MTNATSSLALILGVGVMTVMRVLLQQKSRLFSGSALFAAGIFFASSSLGLMASPSAVLSAPQTSAEPAPEQQLQATTSAGKYIGLEYVQGASLDNANGDQEIIQ